MRKQFLIIAAIIAAGLAANAEVRVNPANVIGKIKLMNAVNNGPDKSRADQTLGNFDEYKALSIPYARTHDAMYCAAYGGPHTVDITQIFPDFSKDVNDPASYDFVHTDMYLSNTLKAGTQIFFRLGQSIEHSPKKYGIIPPADYKKWAQICEHVILHCNEGWADGHHWDIQYWEIWNEADQDRDKWETDPKCWAGSPEEFFKFYATAASYLKKKFPDLKIGGPAIAGAWGWAEDFLAYMQKHKVGIDFFSWHGYEYKPESFTYNAKRVRGLLDKYGYTRAESILNEWNYIKGWSDTYFESVEVIGETRGAAFTAATMTACQAAPVDMLMYYDFRLSTSFNGAFDIYTQMPRKPYYAFYAWKKILQYGTSVEVSSDEKDVYAVASVNPEGRLRVMVTRYNPDMNDGAVRNLKIKIEGAEDGEVLAHITDDWRSYTEIPLEVKDGVIELRTHPCTILLLEL